MQIVFDLYFVFSRVEIVLILFIEKWRSCVNRKNVSFFFFLLRLFLRDLKFNHGGNKYLLDNLSSDYFVNFIKFRKNLFNISLLETKFQSSVFNEISKMFGDRLLTSFIFHPIKFSSIQSIIRFVQTWTDAISQSFNQYLFKLMKRLTD